MCQNCDEALNELYDTEKMLSEDYEADRILWETYASAYRKAVEKYNEVINKCAVNKGAE